MCGFAQASRRDNVVTHSFVAFAARSCTADSWVTVESASASLQRTRRSVPTAGIGSRQHALMHVVDIRICRSSESFNADDEVFGSAPFAPGTCAARSSSASEGSDRCRTAVSTARAARHGSQPQGTHGLGTTERGAFEPSSRRDGAETVGFEPTVPRKGHSTLAGWCTKPNYATSPWRPSCERTTAIITALTASARTQTCRMPPQPY